MAVVVTHAKVTSIPDDLTDDPEVVSPVDWNDDHTVTGLGTAAEADTGDFAAAVHTHAISDVTGLQTALDGKAAASHTHTASEITDFSTAADARVSAAIGVTVQAYSANLAEWSGINPSANGASLVSAADYAAMKVLLDLEAGTDFLSPAAIAAAYQPLASVLTNTTASFTTTLETKLNGIEASADVTDAGNVGSSIHGASAKTTPVDADTVPIIDSEASNVLKKVTWANIKATLKTYFDTLYQPLLATLTSWGAITRASGFDTFVATPSSANLKALLTDETGSGAAVFADTPTLVTPILGAATGTSLVLSGLATASAFVPSSSSVPTNGMYLPAANNLGWAINGSAELVLTSGRLGPTTNVGLDLGSATLSFDDFFLGSGSIINFANGNFTLTHSSGVLTASGNIAVADDAYAAGWNGSANVPTKNAVYDKIELVLGTTLPATYQPLSANLTTYAGIAPSANVQSLLGAADYAAMRTQLSLVIGTNVQAYDAGLAALATFNTNGILVQTADNTFAGRTLTGTANQLTVTNGDGVSGNPTISLPADVLIPTVLTLPNTGLHILDTNASHDLIIAPGSNITADRTLTLTTGDADRTLTISGSATVSQDYSTTGNPQFATIELGAASDTTLSRASAGRLAVEGVNVVTISSTDTLTNKTITDPAIVGTITEDVYTITDGAGFAIDPRNGSIQTITLGASRTPTAANWVSGDSVLLRVADGTAYTITWTTIGVVWVGGSAPTLATSGYSHIVLWRDGSTYYGKYVGDTAS